MSIDGGCDCWDDYASESDAWHAGRGCCLFASFVNVYESELLTDVDDINDTGDVEQLSTALTGCMYCVVRFRDAIPQPGWTPKDTFYLKEGVDSLKGIARTWDLLEASTAHELAITGACLVFCVGVWTCVYVY